MSQSTRKKLRIDPAAKENNTTRAVAATVITTVGPNSVLWQTKPHIESAGNALALRATALADATAAVKALELKLAALRGVRDTMMVEFDAAFDVYATSVSQEAETPADVAELGLSVLIRKTHALVPPLGLDATFDLAKSLILIYVHRAPGLRECIVEISADPIGLGTWQRLVGSGAEHAVGGYAPGLYWVRAASARAKGQSDFTGPVAVIVR